MNSSPEDVEDQPASSAGPTVVGIGASAGGLAALKTFFDRVPADSGLAFVVVVHLAPEHKSHLADLLQAYVRVPVTQVIETTPLEANHVYVIPPNANLSAIDTHLRLSKLETQRRERAPIDHFFRTLANAHDGNAIGVVLTGTGSDGTLGIREIKAKGGLIVVQDPSEAEYDGMPQSAIATGMVDRTLPVAEIPEAILRFARTEPKIPTGHEEIPQTERVLLQKVFTQLRARTDRDFSRYKRSTIMRRIARRMQLNYVEDLPAYLEKLREEPDEVRALADDLLITVTNFFRDVEVFEKLEKEVIPRLFDGRNGTDAVRVWSVGCATGEEPYSLAMLLVEEAARREVAPLLQVFASDLHHRSLDRAREGFYPGDIESEVSPERLRRFFRKESGGYRINKELRDLIVFSPHNLLSDPPFSRLDLISCRNLLIYLEREVQRDVVELFHYALNREGVLMLGSAETIEAADLFRAEDKKLCLYRKRNVPAVEPRLPVFPLSRARVITEPDRNSPTAQQLLAYGSLHQRMVELYAPPSLLVSPDNKLVHLSQHAGRYLVHPGGELTSNVVKLVREELRLELRAALQSVRERKEAFDSNPIPVRFNGHARPVVMHVRPALEPEQDGFALVIFVERERATESDKAVQASIASDDGASGERIQELETELLLSRQRLQVIVEEYETSQEEMRASNEEMQSTNEELRSTMEELETSKEELQSINEELQTVNQENRHKVEELAKLTSDLNNLLSATEIATLFLDRDLRILRFTPTVSDLFNVRTTDRGRPISDLTHRLGYDELQADAQGVLQRLVPVEREVQDLTGHQYLTRLLPYRSSEDRIEGIVITFVDITRRSQAEARLRESEERYRLLVKSAREYAIFMLDLAGNVVTWNSGAELIFGYSEEEIIGRPVDQIFTEEDRVKGVPEANMRAAAEGEQVSYDLWLARKDRSRFWATGSLEALRAKDGTLRGFVKVLRDNSERKETEDRLHQHERQLQQANRALLRANSDLEHFAFAASHDLREPLRMIISFTQMLLKAFQEGRAEEASRAAGIIVDGAKRMDQLLNDLLIYTQLNSHEHDPSERTDLNEAMAVVIANLKIAIKDSSAQVTSDRLPVVGCKDSLVIQVLQNLVENAIKYRGNHNPRVHVSAQEDGDGWRLSVTDNGMGIDPSYHSQIFGVFKRLHARNIPGTGMGLAICQRVVERYGGRIWVESAVDQGAVFYLTLPANESTMTPVNGNSQPA